MLTVKDSYHYEDGDEELGEDTFEREPYIVLFGSTKCGKIVLLVLRARTALPWIRGPRETKERKVGEEEGTSGRTRQASVRPHQSNFKSRIWT